MTEVIENRGKIADELVIRLRANGTPDAIEAANMIIELRERGARLLQHAAELECTLEDAWEQPKKEKV
jgi:hypothetical protein